MAIYAVTNGYLDDLPVASIRKWEASFRDYMRRRRPAVGEAIRQTKELGKDTEEALVAAIGEHKQLFAAEHGLTTEA
jgi:F-type H+-transporting ATPase subunit alpha